MLEPIPDLPQNVIGFEARGKVVGTDYEEIVIPIVEARLKEHDKLRMLYFCPKEDFEGADLAAVWDDAKTGLKHLKAWERAALVTDVDWMRNMTKMFGFMMPCKVKVYREAEFEEAKVWISE